MKKITSFFLFFIVLTHFSFSQIVDVNVAGFTTFRLGSNGQPMDGVNISLQNNENNDLCLTISNSIGLYNCVMSLNLGFNSITAEASLNNNITDGVTALDLALIQRHILELQLINDPYHRIAADVNQSKNISTIDIIRIQQVILGLIPNFPDVDSYQFIPVNLLLIPAFNNAFYNMTDPLVPFNIIPGNGISFSYPEFMNIPLTTGINVAIEIDGSIQVAPGQPSLWAFSGLKSGDVNGSNSNNNLVEVETRSLEKVTLTTPKASAQEGDIISIPIMTNTPLDLSAYQMGINFSTEHYELVTIEKGDFADFSLENFAFNELSTGNINTVWFDQKGGSQLMKNNSTLFNVKVKVKQDIENVANWINLNDEVLDNIFYNSEDHAMDVILDQGTDINMSNSNEVNIHPNPANSFTTLTFNLEQASTVSIKLFDNTGKELRIYTQSFNEGQQKFRIDNLDNLPNGILFYKLETNTSSTSGKLVHTNLLTP